MYEKLDKLRADLDRARQRRADAEVKVKQAEDKLREAENSQVLADVSALKLTPEQVAQFLQMAASGQLPGAGAAFTGQTQPSYMSGRTSSESNKIETDEDELEEDTEEYKDDEN